MKQLLQVRVEPEMKEALSKLAKIYQLYDPDLYRLALSHFIMNNRMYLENDEKFVMAMEEKEAYDNSIQQILTLNCLPCIECNRVYGVRDSIGKDGICLVCNEETELPREPYRKSKIERASDLMRYFIYVSGARENEEWQNQREWAVEELLSMDQELFGASLSVIPARAKRESYLIWHSSMMGNLISKNRPLEWFKDFLQFSSKHLLSITDEREFAEFDELYVWGKEIEAAVFQDYATSFLDILKDYLYIDSLLLMRWMQE